MSDERKPLTDARKKWAEEYCANMLTGGPVSASTVLLGEALATIAAKEKLLGLADDLCQLLVRCEGSLACFCGDGIPEACAFCRIRDGNDAYRVARREAPK